MKTQNLNFWNTVLWATMVILIVLVFWLAEESSIHIPGLIFIILGVALVKFLGIGFQFMELKHAHLIWRFSFTSFILLFLIIVILVF
jgi:hypothetical protein